MEAIHTFESFYEVMIPAVENSPQAYAWFSGIPHPLFNSVMHLSCKKESVAEKVDSLIDQVPHGQPVSFWVHPQNKAEGLVAILQERGFEPIIQCPLMTWKTKPIAEPAFDIRPADMKVYHEIVARVYQFDGAIKEGVEKIMEDLDCENYVIYQDEEPVGTGTLILHGSAGGIFNDATLPERREASRPMMEFLMRRAHELRLKELIVLSSPEAEELYKDLGFLKCFSIDIYARVSMNL